MLRRELGAPVEAPLDMTGRIRRDVIDGVTVFWTPEAPRRIGTLEFRVGRSDETLATAGITHLLEHLALFPIGRPSYSFNGSVDHLRTIFHATGTDVEVSGFLSDVSGHLSSLPLDRLVAESRVLQTEAASQQPALPFQHLWFRYGPRGYGLAAAPEYGLHTVDAATLAEWSAARFTRGNAVAWYSGPLPDGLGFRLPDGPRHPPVSRVEISELPARAWIPFPQLPGIGFGLLVARTTANAMALRILTHRLEQCLRYDLGQSYEVSLAYVPLDAAEAIASLFASCLPSESQKVRHHLLAVIDAFAAEGPTREELETDITAFVRWGDDEESIYGELEWNAQNELLGLPPYSIENHLAEMRAVEPGHVRDAFARAATRAYVVDDIGHPPFKEPWCGYPMSSTAAVAGRQIDAAQRRFWQPRQEHLIVGADGVSWVSDLDGTILTVRYSSCAALIREGPLLTLVGEDCTFLRVLGEYWRDGATVVREIEAAIPSSRVVRVEEG